MMQDVCQLDFEQMIVRKHAKLDILMAFDPHFYI